MRKYKGFTSTRFIGPYEKIRIIGKGSFGCVQLVQRRDLPCLPELQINPRTEVLENVKGGASVDSAPFKSKIFAMKVIRKSEMLRKCQEGHLRAERDCLVAAERSRWVVQLIESFQDVENLYLVMEYMVGGDFLSVLLRYDILPEEAAKFYIAEMILCVEEIHNMRWIHRDVKPDNFLVSSSGHLKISDFGLAFDGHWSHHQRYFNDTRQSLVKQLGIQVNGDVDDIEDARSVKDAKSKSTEIIRPDGHLLLEKLGPGYDRKLAKTIVGTSQYMAPEIVGAEKYDGRCDYWSIGIILYEVSERWIRDLISCSSTSVYMDKHHSIPRLVMKQRKLY
jgi:protein-serine/threonine kinase